MDDDDADGSLGIVGHERRISSSGTSHFLPHSDDSACHFLLIAVQTLSSNFVTVEVTQHCQGDMPGLKEISGQALHII